MSSWLSKMVNYVWTYVFQEVLDEHDKVKIVKPPRFGHDYKVKEEMTFKNALEIYLRVSSVDMISLLESYVVGLRLWKKHPGGRHRTYFYDNDSLFASGLRG